MNKFKAFSNSYCILNDGETFQPTTGTIVVEYNRAVKGIEQDLDNGDPRTLHDAVEEGKVKGRVLNVAALVALYDAARAAPNSLLAEKINAVEA